MTKPHSLRRKSKRIAVRLKSETEEHLFGGFDDGAPPAAVSGGGGGGGGDLACLNDISTDLHHQAMRAERDAMVAAGLAPASLTDLEASNFFLHANGSGPNAGMGMVIDRGKEDARAHQRARSPLLQENNHVEMKEYEAAAARTPTYTRVTSKKDLPPPPPRQKSGSLERHSAARQKKETSPTKSQGGERHSHHYHNHRHHHLQIYQPPQHQLTSVPPESPAAAAAAVPVTSASADSLVGTVELHLDKSESVTNEKQGAKRRAAAAASSSSSNRHEKEQCNKSANDRRRHVRSNRRSHGNEFGENCGEITTAAELDATKIHKGPCQNGCATENVNHVIYQPK